MNAIISKALIGATAAFVLGASAASAATVVNGSFEDDAGPAQDGQEFNTLAGGPGSSWNVFDSLPGWTTTSGTGIEIQTARTLTTIDPQHDDHYVELDSYSNSSMQQTINFASTGSYLLSFWYSPRDDRADSNDIIYSIGPLGSVLMGTVTGPGGAHATAVGDWTQILATFVITTAGDYDLVFAASGTDNSYGGFIDNVSIGAVPVPAGGLLLLGALAGLAGLRRRKTA